MNALINAKEIYVEYLGREVLDIDHLEFHEYDRIGLVGANGAGKSTLLKVLLGKTPATHGKITREGNFTYIPQLDDVVVQEEVDHALMGKLGVAKVDMEHMSGGEETRLKIAQALSGGVHGIFADEPTSHLDREGIEFLINQLSFYTGALLVISHDRYFLDQVVDKIWELKDGRINEYWGGYSDYLAQKEVERKNQDAEYKQFIAERDRLEKAIADKKNQARKIDQKEKGTSRKNSSENGGRLAHQKSVGSKQKKLHNAAKNMEHRIEALGDVRPSEAIRSVRFRQSKSLELHNPFPITGKEISKQIGEKFIFEKASFQFPLGAKIAVTGDNGAGKTTLFKMILNREDGIILSPKAEIGYFAQNSYKFDRNQYIMEFIQEDCDYQVSEIRAVLASLGFSQHDVRKQLSVLSGGEIMKLQLAKMLLGRYNILLMDEPSNFLDLPTVESLEHLMKSYAGTIIFISHDARLVENVADQVYAIEEKQIIRKK
ncbi:Msr family ABC-F type ribosomal protection protein [Paenibacillus antibioticophila]|uniref:Msr family ABC-F type ribosomal protection protein n=1 Tax=Paenibacillus antibioticophila TaxID=1274374 RepID=A0A919XTN5_9BACL|nr:Msr family ABC-F type ribosomal protection protein [Paenibacillus antibioticophila]GIO37373.1 Msr family ABC-F type ribosomal protection protein [Paenibacillus antibioticophila]